MERHDGVQEMTKTGSQTQTVVNLKRNAEILLSKRVKKKSIFDTLCVQKFKVKAFVG